MRLGCARMRAVFAIKKANRGASRQGYRPAGCQWAGLCLPQAHSSSASQALSRVYSPVLNGRQIRAWMHHALRPNKAITSVPPLAIGWGTHKICSQLRNIHDNMFDDEVQNRQKRISVGWGCKTDSRPWMWHKRTRIIGLKHSCGDSSGFPKPDISVTLWYLITYTQVVLVRSPPLTGKLFNRLDNATMLWRMIH